MKNLSHTHPSVKWPCESACSTRNSTSPRLSDMTFAKLWLGLWRPVSAVELITRSWSILNHILIRWTSGLSWWTGIRNDAPNQEGVASIPAAGRSRKVFIWGGNSNGFSFRSCLLLFLTIPPTRPHQLCWKYLPSINKAPLPFTLFYQRGCSFPVQMLVLDFLQELKL